MRLQPLGHLSGVNRMEGTTLTQAFGQTAIRAIPQPPPLISILWVRSSEPQLEGKLAKDGRESEEQESY